jgi:hypothetical protein
MVPPLRRGYLFFTEMTLIGRIRRWWDGLELTKDRPLHVFKDRRDNTKIVISKDLWVTITDGHSKDSLPLSFCSQEMVDALEEVLRKRYGLRKKDAS